MLDNSETKIEAEAEVKEPDVQAEDTVAAEEPEIVIAIEGEEPEVDPDAEVEAELGEAGKRALKAARDAAKENARKAREAEERAAALEAQYKPKEDPLGPMPVIADYGFNDERHAEALIAWHEKKRAIDEQKKAEEDRQKAATEAYEAKRTRYFEDRPKVGLDDEAEARVVSRLNAQQQAALMDASGDPAKVVAALAKSPKALDELSGIKEIHKFTYRLAQIEGKITVTTKAPPPPETRIRGGAAPVDAISTTSLEKLRERAEASGDYSAYFAEKRRRQEAGVKA